MIHSSIIIPISLMFAERDVCKSTPCQNGGNCNNIVNGFTCSCKNAYVGNNCESGHYCCL